jgi:hypothetical protein
LIKYLTYEEIDKQRWDDCIYNSFNGIIYAYSWYLDIVSPKWEALVENDYERVLPLTSKKKSGIHYLSQPFFTQQLGVFSRSKLNEDLVEEFILAIPSRYKFIEINLNTFNKLNPDKFRVHQNLTHELDLIPSYETLYHGYAENTKRNIRQALGSEFKYSAEINADEIIRIFRQNRGREIQTLKEKEYLLLKKIITVCLYKKIAHIKGVRTREGKLCAGAVFVESNKKVIFLFSATNDRARSGGAMSFLIDSFIKDNSQRNLTLDFEGSNDLNLARFYKSFGAKECIYFQYKKNELPWVSAKIVTFIKWIRAFGK